MIVTIRDNKEYIRVPLYSYYTTIKGWGVLLISILLELRDQGFEGLGPVGSMVQWLDFWVQGVATL